MCFLVVWTNVFIRKMPDKYLLQTLIIYGIFVHLFSCQTSEKVNEYKKAEYFVRFTAADSVIKAQANFKDHAGNLQTFLGGVYLFQEKMNLEQKDSEYTLDKKIPPPEKISIQFQDESREEVGINLPFYSPEIETAFSSVDRKEPYTLKVNKALSCKDCSLGIFIIDSLNKTVATFFDKLNESTEYVIPQTKLAPIRPGQGKLFLRFKQKTQETKAGYEHTLQLEYYSVPLEVTIQ